MDASLLIQDVIINGIERGIYYRGSMSYGDFYRREEEKYSFIIGPAVDEAAEWYDKSDIIGVYTTPSSKFILDGYTLTHSIGQSRYLKYNIPMKGNKFYNTWALNWPIAISFKLGTTKISKSPDDVYLNRHQELKENKKWLVECFSRTPIGLID